MIGPGGVTAVKATPLGDALLPRVVAFHFENYLRPKWARLHVRGQVRAMAPLCNTL